MGQTYTDWIHHNWQFLLHVIRMHIHVPIQVYMHVLLLVAINLLWADVVDSNQAVH